MMKLTVAFLLLLSLLSCGKGDSSSSSVEQNTPGVGADYYPRGLDDKIITTAEAKHAPMNFISQDLTMIFDTATSKMKGHSLIRFKMKHDARPYFELQGTLSNVKLDQIPTTVTSISDPDGQEQSYWSVKNEISDESVHEVEFDYVLPSDRVTFADGGVRFLTDMTDLKGKFFEYWGPTGFEEDAFNLTLELKVQNGTSNHKLFTNGITTSSEKSSWKVIFPNYFSKSSFYVHLTNQSLPVKSFVYKGLEKNIPVTVYGLTQALVDSAVSELPKLFKELEKDYGPYPHEKFLAYMNDRGGGMEYVGATITSFASLDHELLHSWFGRSVIPADGRSGWIDEAMASWRDYGYLRASATLSRTPTNLANYSPFKKNTPSNVYVDGRALMAELDQEFADLGGMKTIMKAFVKKYKNKIMTNAEFWSFLGSYTNADVSAFEERYAMGSLQEEVPLTTRVTNKPIFSPLQHSKHPDPLTKEEILRLR